LIGNKCDLKDLRQIEYSKGLKVATEFGLQFEETSAKLDINISEYFRKMAESIANKVILFYFIQRKSLLIRILGHFLIN
jgi:GTPase SAR1 family protein